MLKLKKKKDIETFKKAVEKYKETKKPQDSGV